MIPVAGFSLSSHRYGTLPPGGPRWANLMGLPVKLALQLKSVTLRPCGENSEELAICKTANTNKQIPVGHIFWNPGTQNMTLLLDNITITVSNIKVLSGASTGCTSSKTVRSGISRTKRQQRNSREYAWIKYDIEASFQSKRSMTISPHPAHML